MPPAYDPGDAPRPPSDWPSPSGIARQDRQAPRGPPWAAGLGVNCIDPHTLTLPAGASYDTSDGQASPPTTMKRAERPVLHRWTRHEYERLIDHGFLDEDDPIELLDGLLLVKEPQHSSHRTAVLLVAKAVERAFGEGWFVQTQSPIILDDRSEPEPDVCVVPGSPRDYVDAHPTRPALIVEVAQSGLRVARGRRPRPMRARGSRITGSST